MDGWLKGLVAAACVVVIAGGAYYAWSEYDRKQSAALSRQRSVEANVSPEQCQTMATATLPDNPSQPPKTTRYAEELAICARYGYLAAYEKNQLGLVGIIPKS
jgi:hypothetical protein